MKKRILVLTALLLVSVVTLSSCALINNVVDFVTGIFNPSVQLTDAPLGADMLIDFANGANPDVLFESDGWTNGDVFNVVWKKHNVVYENGIMRLGITEEKASAWLNDAEVEFNYTAGEARTENYYHYGDFEVSMKPSANPGTASTFFTCTGPYDVKFVLDENGDRVLDENGQPVTVENPHDEIDIEFLGNDTTHVQFNFFVDGVGGNEYMHNLGFDASEDFHTYGYRWEPDSITWFVDGEPVYKVTTDTSVEKAGNVRIVEKLPSTPGRILTNYWCGNERAAGWMGVYAGAVKDQGTEYKWIKTSAEGAPLNPLEKPDEEITGIDWSAIEPIAPTFGSTELYTVNIEGNKANVTYTEIGGSSYLNVEMDIAEAAADKNYLRFVVTNNANTDCRFRVNVVDSELVAAGAQNMSTNQSATIDGEAAYTDLVWGGSFFDLKAGQTSEIVICFNGVVEKLQLMPDSSKNDSSVNAGDITVEDIKFAKVGEIDIPDDPTPDDLKPDQPTDPTSGNLNLNIGDFSTTIGGNVADGYGVNVDESGNIQVVYTNIQGNCYKNFWADVSAVAGTKNIFTVKLTNNGDASIKFRIDIESQSQVTANTTACNLSATKNGEGVFTDLEWGGSVFEIAAGETATLEVIYDASKKPTNVKMFADSCQYDDSTYHAGDITISDIAFGGEYIPEEGGDEPVDPAKGEAFGFVANDCYTLSTTETTKVLGVTYTSVSRNTYQNVNAWIGGATKGYDLMTVKIRNNGDATVEITGKLEATGAVALAESKVVIAPGEEKVLTLSFGYDNSAFVEMLFFFIDSGWSEETTTHAGDITISEIEYANAVASGIDLYFTAEEGTGYTIEGTNTVNLKYNGAGNTWKPVTANVAELAAGNNAFTVAIKNNGTSDSRVRVDVQGTTWVSTGDGTGGMGTDACNVTATGGDVWTDTMWGGSTLTVAAGAEVTLTVYYNENGLQGAVKNILVFVDSARGAGDIYSSDITLSAMNFSTEAIPE